MNRRIVISMGQLDAMGISPAESEERLIELAKIIALRIP
jgi:hypothetical protein